MRPNPYRRETSNPPGAGLGAHSRASPRHIKIERKDNGFGFTLRHFIVYPSEDGSDGGPPIQECENIVTFVFDFFFFLFPRLEFILSLNETCFSQQFAGADGYYFC